MSQFYCREDELRKLNKRYAGDKFECIVIYGRRRVGKTALINEFCKDKPTIFFSALNTTGKENLEALSKSIMSYERPDKSKTSYFSDAAAHHRPQMDRVQDVPDSLRLLYELHGESGAWKGKSVVWQTYWPV